MDEIVSDEIISVRELKEIKFLKGIDKRLEDYKQNNFWASNTFSLNLDCCREICKLEESMSRRAGSLEEINDLISRHKKELLFLKELKKESTDNNNKEKKG